MVSVHDHHLLSVVIEARSRVIRLRTAFPSPAGPEFAEAVFRGVEAYRFTGDALGTILFRVREVDSVQLYRQHAEQLVDVYRRNGGHAPWVFTLDDAERFLRANRVAGFEVSSSIGLEGAIWAHECDIQPSKSA